MTQSPLLSPAVRHAGYYVCIEECGEPFGSTYLRWNGDWNSEGATTPYRNNASHWPTAEEATAAYRSWMAASCTRLAETHRRKPYL